MFIHVINLKSIHFFNITHANFVYNHTVFANTMFYNRRGQSAALQLIFCGPRTSFVFEKAVHVDKFSEKLFILPLKKLKFFSATQIL